MIEYTTVELANGVSVTVPADMAGTVREITDQEAQLAELEMELTEWIRKFPNNKSRQQAVARAAEMLFWLGESMIVESTMDGL